VLLIYRTYAVLYLLCWRFEPSAELYVTFQLCVVFPRYARKNHTQEEWQVPERSPQAKCISSPTVKLIAAKRHPVVGDISESLHIQTQNAIQLIRTTT
jgi:hypothetical protein